MEMLGRFYEKLSSGNAEMSALIEGIQREFAVRVDIAAPITKYKWLSIPWRDATETTSTLVSGSVEVNGSVRLFGLTSHAEQQLFSRAQYPITFARKLAALDYEEALAVLGVCLRGHAADGLLVRIVRDNAKGVLSPAYRRMDAAPIFERFVKTALETGFAPYGGYNTDTRYRLDFVSPDVIDIRGELVTIGLTLMTSDYGAGKLDLSFSLMRCICTNLHFGFDLFGRVHLGRRLALEETGAVQFSERTNRLDAATSASKISDVVRHAKELRSALIDATRAAMDATMTDMEMERHADAMRRRGWSKDIVEKMRDRWGDRALTEARMLPEEKSRWRLSNVLSLLANDAQGDTAIDLQREAMGVLVGRRVVTAAEYDAPPSDN